MSSSLVKQNYSLHCATLVGPNTPLEAGVMRVAAAFTMIKNQHIGASGTNVPNSHLVRCKFLPSSIL